MALNAFDSCYAMATMKAAPGDQAAHGMVPANLQINLIGYLLCAVSGMMAVGCLALFVTLLRGVADFIYLAISPAIFVMCLAVVGGWFGGVAFISSALVIGSAVTHWFCCRERSKST